MVIGRPLCLSQQLHCFFRVVAFTGVYAEDGPAFDGKAYIVLNGNYGSTDAEELVNDEFSYAAGTPQAFTVKCSNIGTVQSITVRIEGTGSATK